MPAKKTTGNKNGSDFNFEKSLDELNQIVSKMERGELPLEDSLQYFEQGIGLIRQCQQALKTAEQKVAILTQQAGTETLEPYERDNDE